MSHPDRTFGTPGFTPETPVEFREHEFVGKTILITGASRGIGAAIARRFAQLGAFGIAINSRTDSRNSATAVVNELGDIGRHAGTRALWIPGDIAEEETAATLVQETVQEFGRLDVLINNAGIRDDGLFIRMTDAQMRRVMEANFFGPARVAREGIRQMIKQRPRGGSIVFTSSIATEGSPGQANYSASKGAINALTKTLAAEYQGAGIRVNAVAPGLVETALTSDLTDQQRSALLIATQSERALTPEEVAEHVIFLASEHAAKITGQIIPLLRP